jgi:hypothetical protein
MPRNGQDGVRAVVRHLVDSWRDRGAVDLAEDLAWPTAYRLLITLEKAGRSIGGLRSRGGSGISATSTDAVRLYRAVES